MKHGGQLRDEKILAHEVKINTKTNNMYTS